MTLLEFLTFASDAEIAALCGASLLALAIVARLAEARRVKRAGIDGVGWVPWTGIFLGCAVGGVALLALSAKGLLGG
jgi:hypothetical protein